jgi:hypothetical protein
MNCCVIIGHLYSSMPATRIERDGPAVFVGASAKKYQQQSFNCPNLVALLFMPRPELNTAYRALNCIQV